MSRSKFENPKTSSMEKSRPFILDSLMGRKLEEAYNTQTQVTLWFARGVTVKGKITEIDSQTAQASIDIGNSEITVNLSYVIQVKTEVNKSATPITKEMRKEQFEQEHHLKPNPKTLPTTPPGQAEKEKGK